jgi:hypothetical protein
MKLKGTIKLINETKTFDSGFSVREFVVTTQDDKYPQDIQLQLVKDNTRLLDGIKVSDVIDVEFNLQGREWTSPQGDVKYFNSLVAWKITTEQTEVEKVEIDDKDSLPF